MSFDNVTEFPNGEQETETAKRGVDRAMIAGVASLGVAWCTEWMVCRAIKELVPAPAKVLPYIAYVVGKYAIAAMVAAKASAEFEHEIRQFNHLIQQYREPKSQKEEEN